MEIEPLVDKWRAFGWEVFVCNGHDMDEIITTVEKAKQISRKPSVIIAKTIMGKGIKEIEGDYRWHGKAPNKMESEKFIQELRDI